MASYVFTPNYNSSVNGDTLRFKTLSQDFSSSPFPRTVDVGSSIAIGDYVYALTRFGAMATASSSSSPLYPIDETKGVRVIGIYDSPINSRVTIKLSDNLESNVYGNDGSNTEFDYFLIDRNYNKVNLSKIGFDKKPAQVVNQEVLLSDLKTGQTLQDQSLNNLFTVEKKSFDAALKSINATSVKVTNTEKEPVTIREQFAETSQVSNSLLGVPRAEEQLSLFSDVSTLGLDAANWETFAFAKPILRLNEWENRASEEGSRYRGKMIENVSEQAIELSANPVPYSYPWDRSNRSHYRADQYPKWKKFIFLGNLLWQYYTSRGSAIADLFLNPNYVRWGLYSILDEGSVDSVYYAPGVSQETAFRLIDKWSATWVEIRNENSVITSSFIDSVILDPANNQALVNDLKTLVVGDASNNINGLFDIDYANGDIATEQLLNGLKNSYEDFLLLKGVASVWRFSDSQPGYELRQDDQQVILQSKEVFRYQPGRISGFTFGTRVDIDETSAANYAEWGCVNETDEYVLRLAGSNLSVIRRSTVPLTENSLSLSGGLSKSDERVFEEAPDLINGGTKAKYYEYEFKRDIWNGDPLNGNGRSGYTIDPKAVTMWKIEFSWYGAIGVQFYAYIPVGSGEARWVKVHRIIIENSLPQANLSDPYFRMRYKLFIGDKTVTTKPQFIYKYGSSVYIDGGDEGTKTQTVFSSNEKVVPEDRNVGTYENPKDNFLPMLALRSKRFISNREGKLRPSRIISIPEKLTISTNQLTEVDFMESEAGNGFGYTYDNGLRFRRDVSPALKIINHEVGYQLRFSSSPAEIGKPSQTGHDVSDTRALTNRDSNGNSFTDYNMSPFASRLIDFVFVHENDINKNVTMLELCKLDRDKSPTEGNWSPNHPKTYIALNQDDTPHLISEEDDDAKLLVPGLSNVYIDWKASLADTTNIADGVNRFTDPSGVTRLSRFRLKQIDRTNPVTIDGRLVETTPYEKIAITTENPLLTLNPGGAYNTLGDDITSFSWNSYKTLANPHLPSSRVDTTNGLTYYDGRVGGVRPAISEEFIRNFGEVYAEGSSPFPNLTVPVNTGKSPFQRILQGRTYTYFVKRGVFQKYDNGQYIPYSYAFGRTKLCRMRDAVATTDAGLSGTDITCRFINPHAARVSGLLENPFNGSNIAQGKYPEFRIGFTNLVPTSHQGAPANGNGERWDGKFVKSSGNDFINDSEMIFADYTAKRESTTAVGGAAAFGERNWSNAEIMQDDYRIKYILDEGHVDHNIGGAPSFVRLKVSPESDKYTSVRYAHTFANLISSDHLRHGNAINWQDEAGSNLFVDANDMVTSVIKFPDHPTADDADGYAKTDFPEFIGSSSDKYLILKDAEASGFDKLVDEGLSLVGGTIIIDKDTGTVNATEVDTGVTILSEPVKVVYYATADGVIDQDAYTENKTQVGYIFQIDDSLDADDISGYSEDLDEADALVLKIVTLEYPDGVNGTNLKVKRKVFGSNPTAFYPVIQMREGAQINSINYKIVKRNQPPVVISPLWKTHGAAEVIKPINSDSPGFTRLNNLESATGGVASAIPENFIETNRLSGLESNENMNKRLRKSVSEPDFKGLSGDANAVKRNNNDGQIVYDVRGKLAERSKKVASFYFGPKNAGVASSETIPLYSIFGEDRKKILPDDRGTKVLFIRAQMANNIDGDTSDTAKVRLGVNVSEI